MAFKNAIANQDTEDKVEFYPPRFNDTFLQWMENVHDWVILSSALVGHQIPAWYNAEGEMYVGEEAPEGDGWTPKMKMSWILGSVLLFGHFSTMGWPDVDSEDFKRYFPTSTLVTGYDIIFFWVSRMIFQSWNLLVVSHSKTCLSTVSSVTSKGRKMSKSLGNGIDPMDVIENTVPMPFVGSFQTALHQVKTCASHTEKMDASWNFINKIWNISRYILMNNEGLTLEQATANVEKVVNKGSWKCHRPLDSPQPQ